MSVPFNLRNQNEPSEVSAVLLCRAVGGWSRAKKILFYQISEFVMANHATLRRQTKGDQLDTSEIPTISNLVWR